MNYWKTCQLVMSLPLLGGGKSRLDSLERQPFRYSKYCEESLHKATRQSQSYCHSERSEESLKESLVAKRDSSVVSLPQNDNGIKSTSIPKSNASQKAHSNSSPLAGVQNDNKSQTSFSSEIYSHCDKIKSHEVPPLKASSGRGIYKGARILLWGWSLPARAKLLPILAHSSPSPL
ncbi:hypothetical protein [Helicobacter marmotae]|uniref:hypothetical protein n=1 Tax=Helicobacter marmotae TaxID=152490 RepID=UPI0011C05C3C|nr:hypothetical protein [Helicobacter marmotae]